MIILYINMNANDGSSELDSVVLTSITSNELYYDPSSVDDDIAKEIIFNILRTEGTAAMLFSFL